MPRTRKQEKPGRPKEYSGERRPITTQWPVELIEYVDRATDNRTKWFIEAAEEKMEREKQQ